jgi:hypothetical protein
LDADASRRTTLSITMRALAPAQRVAVQNEPLSTLEMDKASKRYAGPGRAAASG